MRSRSWVNLGLLSLTVILTIFVLSDDQETEKELQRLSTIDKNTIKQIQVFRKDLDSFQFDKKDNGWFLTSPQQYRANNARINAMLRILEVESHAQLNLVDIDLKQLGLDNPIVTMKLNDHVFQFGNTDAIDQRRYVLFQNKIHLTNDSLYQQLMTNAAFFADPGLIPDGFKISSIEYPNNILEHIDEQCMPSIDETVLKCAKNSEFELLVNLYDHFLKFRCRKILHLLRDRDSRTA